MLKKLTVFCVIFVLLFSVVGLAACNNGDELAEYKTQAIESLEAYADQSNYSEENWTIVLGLMDGGKVAIDEAADKDGVDNAVSTTKTTINSIPTKEEVGMEVEVKGKILQDYYNLLNSDDITLQDVYIRRFYGVYNDSFAVIMAIYGIDPPPAVDEIMVSGLEFTFNTGYHIKIWNDGDFYSLQDAFDESFITLEDLETICELHNVAGL
ncbi:MAG: hypothetical protein WC292_03825 [Clostridia bacterium]